MVDTMDQVDCTCTEATRTHTEGQSCTRGVDCAAGLICDLSTAKCQKICKRSDNSTDCTGTRHRAAPRSTTDQVLRRLSLDSAVDVSSRLKTDHARIRRARAGHLVRAAACAKLRGHGSVHPALAGDRRGAGRSRRGWSRGFTSASGGVLVGAALVLGFVNAVVRPILVVLTLPLTVLTLGLFYLVVNGAAFGLAAALVPGFEVASLGSAVEGALVVAVVSWLISWLMRSAHTPTARSRMTANTRRRRPVSRSRRSGVLRSLLTSDERFDHQGPSTPAKPRRSCPRRFGSFTLLSRIAEGKRGDVYAALRPVEVDRFCAIKILPSWTAGRQEIVAPLRAEAPRVVKQSHGNVVPIYDIGAVDDRLFFVSELAEGGSLDALLRALGGAPRDLPRGARRCSSPWRSPRRRATCAARWRARPRPRARRCAWCRARCCSRSRAR